VVFCVCPLVNLVRGVQVMRDLWIESQPLPIDGAAQGTLVRRAPLVGWWWAMWILTTLSVRIVNGSTRISLVFSDDPMMKYALNVITGVLFIAVLRGIARRQREWDDLVRRQPVPPPTDQLR